MAEVWHGNVVAQRQISPTQKAVTVCPPTGTIIATPLVGSTVAVVGLSDYYALRDADPAAEVEALRKELAAMSRDLGEWQRGERLHPSETQAHAAGAEQVLARVRGRLDQDDKAAYYNVRLGERLRRLRRDLEAMLTNAVGQTPCTVCGRPRHDNHCNDAAPEAEVPETEAECRERLGPVIVEHRHHPHLPTTYQARPLHGDYSGWHNTELAALQAACAALGGEGGE